MRNFPFIAMLITALVYAGFAVWLGSNPVALLSAFGIETSTPEMLTEIRAFYGGIELAIGVVMMVLWGRGDRFASLLVGGLPLAASASGRLVGIGLDGYSALHLGMAFLELCGAVTCFVGCYLVRCEGSSGK